MAETPNGPMNPELATRLKSVYGLPREPTSVEDYYALVEARSKENPRAETFIQKMKDGRVVMGETSADRGYSVSIPEKGRVNVMCGYDAVVTAVVRGEGLAQGRCPHCGETMDIRIEEGRLAKASPDSIVFWLGTGPPGGPGHPVCDHLHLFPTPAHLEAWLEEQPGELGLEVSLGDLVKQVRED